MCKSPEAENWCFKGLSILKEDVYICSMVNKDKGLSYGFSGKKSWGSKELGVKYNGNDL